MRSMTRASALTALALLAVSIAATPARATTPVNVLVIIADDIGLHELAAYQSSVAGSDPAVTPALDELAEQGVVFTRAWADPVCTPTRATVYTGRYGVHTGVGTVIEDNIPGTGELQADELTLGESLGAAGYATALIGKWHVGYGTGTDAPDEIGGFDHFAGLLSGALADYSAWDRTEDGESTGIERTYATTSQVNDAIDWIRDQSDPWMLTLAFNAPHAPFHVPPNRLLSRETKAAVRGMDDDDCVGPNGRVCYKAAIEAMDAEIGRLFDRTGADPSNTLIFFVGDNGAPSEVVAPGVDPTKAKGTVFEPGIRVPFMVAGPMVTDPGRLSTALVNTVDIFATVAQETGAQPPVGSDSNGLLEILEAAPDPTPRTFVYSERFRGPNPHTASNSMAAYSNGTIKVIEQSGILTSCFDLASDPQETQNLWDPSDPDASCVTLYNAMEAGPHAGL
ncbi:MAG: sulfatase-like hydrolase/transferase [Actinomycetota bacterium]